MCFHDLANKNVLRHTKGSHEVQRLTANQQLSSLSSKCARRYAVAKNSLHAKHARLCQTPAMIILLNLPLFSSHLPHTPHIFISRKPFCLHVARVAKSLRYAGVECSHTVYDVL